jgi:hypothetical protein
MPELHQSIAQHYHDRTKYDPQTLATKNHQIDWAKQPVPFKEYKIGTNIDLKPYLEHQQLLKITLNSNGGQGYLNYYFIVTA